MALPKFTMKQLLEAGVHFGHHTRRFEPLMTPYVFGIKDSIRIIDLNKTAPLLHRALTELESVAAAGGKIMFIATKPQARELVKEAAERCGQFYVNSRWLGGMMTNWGTISQSIRRMKHLEKQIEDGASLGLTKKEILNMTKEVEKLRGIFGGILDMHGVPQAVVIIDVPHEYNAVKEAAVLGIPAIAICDTNANPSLVEFPVPGNDDAARAIRLYCDLFSDAILSGIEKRLAGKDVQKSKGDIAAEEEDELEEKVVERELKEKSKTSEARAVRREKLAEKAEEKSAE
ncbi:MAG: 30S ribosomal protein S2 [Rickettsiales bacterium]|nr:30S ribosomal protein S2 [Rickettsiales bacterium]